MPSIVIYNDKGNILYQNIVNDVLELVNTIHEGGILPGYSESTPPVRINGMIILAEDVPLKKDCPQADRKTMYGFTVHGQFAHPRAGGNQDGHIGKHSPACI